MGDVEDAGRKVHRSAEHASKWNYDCVFGRVGRITPGVIFLPARALPADHVRPSSAQAGILDGLMRVDCDVMGGRDLGHVKIMTYHVLAGEPLTTATAVDDVAAVADISRLDSRDTV